jgi:hypothetical protein
VIVPPVQVTAPLGAPAPGPGNGMLIVPAKAEFNVKKKITI